MDMARVEPCNLNNSNQKREVKMVSLSLTIVIGIPWSLKTYYIYREAILVAMNG